MLSTARYGISPYEKSILDRGNPCGEPALLNGEQRVSKKAVRQMRDCGERILMQPQDLMKHLDLTGGVEDANALHYAVGLHQVDLEAHTGMLTPA